jgi:hypothetical protein
LSSAKNTVANAYHCDIFDARGEGDVQFANLRFVVECRFVDLQETARASCADLERCYEKAGAIALLRRLYSSFCDDLLKHLAIKTQISDELFELTIFFSKLTQHGYLWRAEPTVLLFPKVKRVLVNAHLPDDLGNQRAGFSLSKCLSDLARRISFSHGQNLLRIGSYFAEFRESSRSSFQV